MIKLLSSIFIVVLALSSCCKLASEVNSEFVGTWNSTDLSNSYHLVIESDNKARWDRVNSAGDTVETYLGTAQIRKSSNTLIIGDLSLKISQYPTFDSSIQPAGAWVCTLENWPFIRE